MIIKPGEVISVEAFVGHCSTCAQPLVLGKDDQPEGKFLFTTDDAGNRWIMPHRNDCPRLLRFLGASG